MRKQIIMSIHTEEFSTDISFKMVPAWQYGHLGMQVRRGFADWTQCSDPQHQPVSFICFISIVRSIARSFNSQELTKSLLRHLFKDDSPKNMRVKNIKWSRRFLQNYNQLLPLQKHSKLASDLLRFLLQELFSLTSPFLPKYPQALE